MDRRHFIKLLASTPILLNAGSFLAFADSSKPLTGRKPFVLIMFLRGGADGLNILSPVGDELYYKLRPNTAIKDRKDKSLMIDDHFQINPVLQNLHKYWTNKNLAFINEFGSPSKSRSHFDAQDFIGSGVVDNFEVQDGFLNRFSQNFLTEGLLPVVSIQHSPTRFTTGNYPIINIKSLNEFDLIKFKYPMEYYHQQEKNFLGKANPFVKSDRLFEAMAVLKEKNKLQTNVKYPEDSRVADQLKDIAKLVKSDVDLSIGVTEMRGWDTHVLQGNDQGAYEYLMRHLADCLDAFITDIGDRFADTHIVVLSEFGRTVKENGNKGTDHGHGTTGIVLGGNINGGMYGEWSGLDSDDLYENRDLNVTTDYRSLLSGVLRKNFNLSDLKNTFPDFEDKNKKLIDKILKT